MSKKNILVIGAGIVGLSTAYYLQSSNNKVTLVDYQEPGSGTSRGHASMIANYGVPGINQPQVWYQLPKYLFSSNSPIAIKWSNIMNLAPWLIKFLHNCNNSSMYLTAQHTSALLKKSLADYKELLADIEASQFLTHQGVLYVWTDNKQQPTQKQIDIRNLHGIEQIKLTKLEINELEPNLSSNIQGGWHFPKAHHVLDPDVILKKLFHSFSNKGGAFQKDEIHSVENINEKILYKEIEYDGLVVCTGAFSKKLVKQIEGKFIPLETERGYHIEFPGSSILLNRPTCLVESGMYLTPLNGRIRAAGTVELDDLSLKISKDRINYLFKEARRILPALKDYKNPWLGFRPTLPDCLPIISPSPKFRNIYYAFGHNHLGWTLGPTTGKMINGLISRNIDINKAFSIERYL